MMKLSYLVLAALLVMLDTVRGECVRETACSCREQQTSQLVSLYQLANLQGKAGLHVDNGSFVFEFNPCVNITSPVCEDVAFCQYYSNAPQGTFYNLGTQDSVQFSGSSLTNNLQIELQGITDDGGHKTTRTTIVNLICSSTTLVPHFEFVSVSGSTYVFNLTSKCACAGMCDPPPEKCIEDEINHCACQLTPGNGVVNLRSLDDPSSPLITTPTVPEVNATGRVYFNPCSGMTAGPSLCAGSTVCLQLLGVVTPFGTSQSKQYSVDGDGNTVVSYSDGAAEAHVKLVCDYTARHLPKLSAILPEPQRLEMEMRTICACPGACISPPISCTPIDDCSCKISEDGGSISLHDLDNPLRPLSFHHSTGSGDGETFVYNPCSNFSIAGHNDNCLEVAGCVFGGYATPDYSDNAMGLQNTTQFRVSQEGVVTISYSDGTQGRQFSVILICNRTMPVPLLTWLSENPQHNYHLQLEGAYGCLSSP